MNEGKHLQVKFYELVPGEEDAFLHAWKTSIIPLRREFGFTVKHAWLDRDTHSFVWVIDYEGEGDARAALERYTEVRMSRPLDPDPLGCIKTFGAEPFVDEVPF